MTTPHIRGNKSGRLFRKDTTTYKLFEQYFLDLEEGKLPFALGPMARGQAINLAMGLNRCQIQWAKEVGVGEDMLTRSAKAKDLKNTEGEWILEISTNQRHTRAGPTWMNNLLFDLKRNEEMGQKQGEEVKPAEEVDVMEELLRKGGYVD